MAARNATSIPPGQQEVRESFKPENIPTLMVALAHNTRHISENARVAEEATAVPRGFIIDPEERSALVRRRCVGWSACIEGTEVTEGEASPAARNGTGRGLSSKSSSLSGGAEKSIANEDKEVEEVA
jgi:hypothetical protein